MKNVDMSIQGSVLTIKVDLSKNFGRSASGKSIIIASTEGNLPVDGTDGSLGVIGLNVYRRA